MSTPAPGLNSYENKIDHKAADEKVHGLSKLHRTLSLGSKTIHADDYLNKGTDVAPPLHVSTTFRYNKNPDNLQVFHELDVNITNPTLPHIT
jgi:cystathionine beta-lyase